ncbi:substrate-binding domain-containing protein [Roseobacter sp. HKCCD9010]|uniref:LacI family DNA-binding transcriptional regulator n=1 Tax=unclassified Roseobacter TaxID=196798 RepID=UPI001490B6BE|nr:MULTISPECIES: LacI family DNA-binding transcriptional regulator [unclassified Roseobacter]MBF9051800.1 substrate-binding domain-containing protein [Rhodobacterales bacterium HKCCD4356]NNV13793.1 substrate-binding domain-containing protein [Roseobacter sp. HKCCD7357]NNV17818.1 substrate-binding domain-containing protein [Roseobacter sp. HKCCD8768]NNV27425.1 substrate-binding domain-containing protein [Roseobacter sp. HKCCD8192]NNV31545.1 substrate-binding domain-containing protein [Roseobact
MSTEKSVSKETFKRARRVTAADVAKAAGVSRSAVSRAFTPGAYLDSAKRVAILATAKRLGYRPNALAASLQGNRTDLVAVIAGDMANHYDAAFVGALVAELNAHQKWPLVLSGSDELTEQSIRSVLRYPLDAVIVRGGSLPASVFQDCARLSIPVISSGRVVDAPATDCAACRNKDGAELAIRTLLARGRTCFGYIGGPASWSSETERLAGVRHALAEAGLELCALTQSDYTFDGGRAAAETMFATSDIDALFCANDAMALGALSAARNQNRAVPDQLSIIGFDDIALGAWPDFDLTTIRNPLDKTIAEILRLLEARLKDPSKDSETVMIDPELIARGTH